MESAASVSRRASRVFERAIAVKHRRVGYVADIEFGAASGRAAGLVDPGVAQDSHYPGQQIGGGVVAARSSYRPLDAGLD